MKKDLSKNSDIAISVKNVSKTFRIPHEKVTSIRGAVTGVLKRNKGYEEFKALDDVSFEVKKGEFFGIIGRNGSGKSTLLKILAGIYQADKGRVKINGMISPFLELGIGFNPELSGRDNVYLNATVLGMTKKQIDEKFDAIVKFSELERFIDQKLKNYSSGMQVRLAFSVSIHANREILLMDEVLAVGDSNFQAKCIREFVKYKEMGKTVIIVTHDISVVQRYCDMAIFLKNGKINEIGKASEIIDKYIFSNINDQKERQEDDIDGNSVPDKHVEIKDVEILDENGKNKNIFETGEKVSIKIHYKKHKNIKKINFGIGFRSSSNDLIFGYNTNMDKYQIDEEKEFLIFNIDSLSILNGEYYINVACFGFQEEDQFDYKPKIKTLRIYSKGVVNSYKGFLNLVHDWK